MSGGTEHLRSVLAEREKLLQRERISASHAQTLLGAMDALHATDLPDQGIVQVLEIARSATDADLAVLLCQKEGEEITTWLTTSAALGAQEWRIDPSVLQRTLRVTDLARKPWSTGLPPEAAVYSSFVSCPVAVAGQPPMAIALLCSQSAKFSRIDQNLLQRIASLLERAIDRLQLIHRNSILAQIVNDEISPAGTHHFSDSSVEVLSRAFSHVVYWQRNIVDITNKLLNAPSEAIDSAINTALARTGQLARSDRTYVFRTRSPGRLDNTHEWVAEGIVPMIDELQDLPDTLLADWGDAFASGQPVAIPDVDKLPDNSAVREMLQMQGIRSLLAVPMLLDGRLTGFVGYDAVRNLRSFLPVEIELLRSVGNAIDVVLDRARAEQQAKQANFHLRQERDRYRATLAAIPHLVLELDSEGRFVNYGAGARLAPEYPLDDVLNRMPEEVLPRRLAQLVREIMEIVARNGYSSGHCYPMMVQGERRWFEASAAAKSTEDGGGGFVFLVHDITESYQQQRQIRRLGRIAELTSNLVIVTDAEGHIDWVNPAFETRSGWALEEVRGRKPGDFLQSPKTDRATLRRIGAALKKGQPVQAQLMNRNRAGQDYWITKDIQPLLDEAGRLDGFVSVQTDITDLQEAHQRALRIRALAMETASDGIAISDSKGAFVYMNAAHRQMFGIGPHEDVSALSWQDFLPEQERVRFLETEFPTLEATGTWRGELAGLHRDGHLLQQQVTLNRIDDGGLLCFARDIAQQRAMENERARLREDLQLAQRRETIAQLASGVAHDLNNLVAVVSGTVSLLEGQAIDKPEICAGLTRIARAMDAARDLVSGLGRSTRPDAPRKMLDLRQVVVEAVDLLGSERSKKHAIQIAVPDHAVQVWANHTELLQVVLNLALNACEASAVGTSTVSLGVRTGQDTIPQRMPDVGELDLGAAYSVFVVADTGTGLDPSIHDKLFESYVTTKGDAGTGMGLAIVAGILRDNACALWFDSEAGKGVTVTVAWPKADMRPKAAPRAAPLTSRTKNLAGSHILVVDDVIDVADVLSEMLEMDGAISIAVSDPAEAVQLLTDNPALWSAVVTDLDMQDKSGIDIARTAAMVNPSVPCVLVTALPERAAMDRGLFHSVLAKPIEAPTLLKHVRAAVSTRMQGLKTDE